MPQTRVYVGGLNPRCRERDLERFFEGYGRLKSLMLRKGYGFIEFEDSHDAKDAVYNLNGMELLGYKVQVEYEIPQQFRNRYYYTNRGGGRWNGRGGYGRGGGRGGGGGISNNNGGGDYASSYYNMRQMKRGTGFTLIVKNLSSRVSWQDLKDFMAQAGEVAYADVCGQLNEGTVEYRTYNDLRKAIDLLDNTELAGWKIRLIEEVKTNKTVNNKNYRYSSGSSSNNNVKHRRDSRSLTKSRSRSPVN